VKGLQTQTSCKDGTGCPDLGLPLGNTSLVLHRQQLLKGCPTPLTCRDSAKSCMSTPGTQEIKTLG